MLKFKGINNYYFTLISYIGNKAVDRKEVWYLDGKYKIKETYSSYDKDVIEKNIIYFINIKDNTQKEYLEDNLSKKIIYSGSIYHNETYQDGNLLYSYFPQILKNDIKQIIKYSLKFGLLKIIDTKENIRIMYNDIDITIDKKTGIPIRQKNTENREKEEMVKMEFLESEFNCVRDEDIVDTYEK